MITIISIRIFFILVLIINAQVKPNYVTESFQMKSDVLTGNITVQIHVPNSYNVSKNRFPVLYVLDGEVYFPLTVSISNMLQQFNSSYVPDFLIVSITKKNELRERYGLYNDTEMKLVDFLENELIPKIESKFRTSDRYLFGWQYAGSLAVRCMVYKPNLFNSYFVADPYPLMSKFDRIYKDFYESLNKLKKLHSNLYLTYGFNGGTVKEGAEYLKSQLNRLNIEGLNYSIKELKDEDHRSTPFNSIYSGMKSYHYNYPQLQIKSLDELKENGGLDYVYDYYEKRSLRYGFPRELGEWTKFTLIRTAMRENNFDMFEFFIKEFTLLKEISEVKLSRSISIAKFYEQHLKPDIALSICLHLYNKYSTSIELNKYISKLYKSQDNVKLALKYSKQATDLEKK